MAPKKDYVYKQSPSLLVRLMALNSNYLYKRSPSVLAFRYSRNYYLNAALPPLFGALFCGAPFILTLLNPHYLFLSFIFGAPFVLWLRRAWCGLRICLQGRLYLFDAQSGQISLNGRPLLRLQDVQRVLVTRNPGFHDSYPVGLSLCNGGWVEIVEEIDLVEAQKIADGIANFMRIRHEKAW